MLTSSTQLQSRSFHVVERTRTSAKWRKVKNARAKRAKLLFFRRQICKFVTFSLTSWLLKLPNKITRPKTVCFIYFLGVWNLCWNTRTRCWYITSSIHSQQRGMVMKLGKLQTGWQRSKPWCWEGPQPCTVFCFMLTHYAWLTRHKRFHRFIRDLTQ